MRIMVATIALALALVSAEAKGEDRVEGEQSPLGVPLKPVEGWARTCVNVIYMAAKASTVLVDADEKQKGLDVQSYFQTRTLELSTMFDNFGCLEIVKKMGTG